LTSGLWGAIKRHPVVSNGKGLIKKEKVTPFPFKGRGRKSKSPSSKKGKKGTSGLQGGFLEDTAFRRKSGKVEKAGAKGAAWRER